MIMDNKQKVNLKYFPHCESAKNYFLFSYLSSENTGTLNPCSNPFLSDYSTDSLSLFGNSVSDQIWKNTPDNLSTVVFVLQWLKGLRMIPNEYLGFFSVL